jgi:hypothetical protein
MRGFVEYERKAPTILSSPESSVASRDAAFAYPSSHRSRYSIWSEKWRVVARKVGESNAASFNPTGLYELANVNLSL